MSPEAERAEMRVRYSRRELERALQSHDARDPHARRMLRKLEEDLERAESDLAHARPPRENHRMLHCRDESKP